MEAKEYQEIINTADCNAEVNFVGADGELKVLGWAKQLIDVSYKAGLEQKCFETYESGYGVGRQAGRQEVVDYLRERIILSGQTDAPFTPPKKISHVDFLPIPYSEWQAKLKEWGI